MFATVTATVTLALGALGACQPACQPTPGPAPRPPCTAVTIDGVAVVTFMHDDPITCDVSPPQQLNLVFDASYDPAWGGDASVARAATECDDMGGRQLWVQNPYRLICQDIDY